MVRQTLWKRTGNTAVKMDMSFNSSVSLDSISLICFKSTTAILIFTSYVIAYILFLSPLFLLIVYLGVQRRRRRRSWSTSHSDFFTYNVIVLELLGILGSSFYSFGAYAEGLTVQIVGVSMCSISSPGQTLFHLLTCVERYLAVVHPIAYLALKRAGGVRIRNISAGCVWLLCAGLDGISKLLNSTFIPITHAGLMVFSLVLLFVCSCSVLNVLNVPGPGQVSGDLDQVDRAKLRAFHTIVAITTALLLRFVGVLVCNVMFTSPALTHTKCAVGASAMWLTLPCSLVLPLLFLQRAGKLPGRTRSSESG